MAHSYKISSHGYHVSSNVEKLIMDASKLAPDVTTFNKVKFSEPSIVAYSIPWKEAWNTLVTEAVEELKSHWKEEGATIPWPYGAKAMELRSGGIYSLTAHKSIVIPLTMDGQSKKVAFLQTREGKVDDGSTPQMSWDDLEEWKIALYMFGRREKIQALVYPIRFIWVEITKPETEVQPESDISSR